MRNRIWLAEARLKEVLTWPTSNRVEVWVNEAKNLLVASRDLDQFDRVATAAERLINGQTLLAHLLTLGHEPDFA